jgi:hypothetical protein
MKIAVLLSLARQVEGEYVFGNIIKAHVDPEVLRNHLANTELPKTVELGGIGCVIEYGVIEDVEVEGLDDKLTWATSGL